MASSQPGGGMSERPSRLVVVGSSAGGIEALATLLGGLDADFPAPIVLAQHLDPERPSMLADVLRRRTALAVQMVDTEDETALVDGHVYVVAPNRQVLIRDGRVAVESDGTRPRPSVDLLLKSAAESYGERLVAVILTGRGSDGAAGAVEVKNAGGVVVVQNPHTAAFASMPLAVPPTAVDYVRNLPDISSLLSDLVANAAIVTPPSSPDGLASVLALVGKHAHIDFRSYKPTSLQRRVSRRMAVVHATTLEEYTHYLEEHPEEMAELVMSLLIKVTEFFRDPEAFSYIRREILPELVARGRETGRSLRIWSAGCATGEEAYSLAMLVAEMRGAEMSDWTVKIFATDLDENAVAFARRGVYPENVLRDVPPAYLDRYFERSEQGRRVSKSLRQLVMFGQQDLARGVPFPRIDLVVCRNLLIYFKPELQQSVLDLFAYALHPSNGYLFLGKAETARPSK